MDEANWLRQIQVGLEQEWKTHHRFWEFFAATSALVAMGWMAVAGIGFFADVPPTYSVGPSVWDYLFGTQPALGAVRLAVFALSAFLIASLAALLVAGRWVRGVGTVTTDDPAAADPDSAQLERSIEKVAATTEEILARYLGENQAGT